MWKTNNLIQDLKFDYQDNQYAGEVSHAKLQHL